MALAVAGYMSNRLLGMDHSLDRRDKLHTGPEQQAKPGLCQELSERPHEHCKSIGSPRSGPCRLVLTRQLVSVIAARPLPATPARWPCGEPCRAPAHCRLDTVAKPLFRGGPDQVSASPNPVSIASLAF